MSSAQRHIRSRTIGIGLIPAAAILLIASGCGGERNGMSTDDVTRIAAVGLGSSSSGSLTEVTLRRVATGNDYDGFAASAISPDGRYISLIDWSTNDLAVRDLRTGELHPLTNTGGGADHAATSLFSPDGQRMVYGWQGPHVLQLRLLDFDPDALGAPRPADHTVLLSNPTLSPYRLFDWSPDGSQILAKVYLLPGGGTGNQLALISTADGTYRALKSFDWREPERAAFSPDGKFIVYDFLPDPDSPDRDVFVLSLDGTHEARIFGGPSIDRVLGWHPDGSILVLSDRDGTPGLWRVPMSEGRPAGPAELLRADMWQVAPLGFVDDAFYYGVNVSDEFEGLYVADVDLASGKRTGQPIQIRDSHDGAVQAWGWSPDGEHLAYVRTTRGADELLIVIRSDAGEEVQAFALDLDMRTGFLRWDSDGKSIILYARDAVGRAGFHRIDLQTASYTTIVRSDQLERPIRGPGYFDVSADGRTLWFVTVDYRFDPWRFELVAYDVHTGDYSPVPLEDADLAGARVSVSGDGSRLAIVTGDSPGNRWVATIPVEGGEVTPIAPIDGDAVFRSLEWSPDGRHLVMTSVRTSNWPAGFEVSIVPAHGGEVDRIELIDPPKELWRYVQLHPLRNRIAFRAGEDREEIWAMDGLGDSDVAAGSARRGNER